VRRGFTLIELLFAIIVVSIAMLALPALFRIASASANEIVKDEATFQGFQTAGILLTYSWDDNSIDPDTLSNYILDTNGDSELNRVPNTVYRIGNIRLGKRRRFFTNITNATQNLGLEEATLDEADDIDDFHNNTETITSNLLDLTITTTVSYVSDTASYANSNITFTFGAAPAATPTNIKMILINVANANDNTNIIRYAAFATNIGGTKIQTRVVQ